MKQQKSTESEKLIKMLRNDLKRYEALSNSFNWVTRQHAISRVKELKQDLANL